MRVSRDLLDWNHVISFFSVDPLQPIINLCNLYRCKKKLKSHCLVYYTKREVFAHAISERATAIIVAHNHPSGLLKPSIDDITVTKRLLQAGELLGIRVLDHLIFSDESFRSMLAENELT